MNRPVPHHNPRPRIDFAFWVPWIESAVTIGLTIALMWAMARTMGLFG